MLFNDKLSDIIRTLENDGVLLHPTDTIWGLACSILSEKAYKKIYAMKQRDENRPLLLLADSLAMVKKYVPHIHPRIETLLHFHNKPLTVVYPDVKSIPAYLRAKNDTVAIRIIHDPYCNQIIKLLGCPLVSTSANLSGLQSPQTFSDISETIIEQADFVAFHRRDEKMTKKPSVIINYDMKGEINFLRL